MNNLKIFVLHNDENYLNKIKVNKHIEKINLNNLSINKIHSRNELAENRFMSYLANNLSIIQKYEYIGIASARWNEKYKVYKEKKVMPIEEVPLVYDEFKKSNVYVAAPISNWYSESCDNHKGIDVYINELLERNKFKKTGMSFYSNNFICTKKTMVDFLKWWIKEFNYFFEKYGTKYNYDSSSFIEYKENVNCAYFYERLTISYFANKKYNIVKLNPDFSKMSIFNKRQEEINFFNRSTKIF